MTRLQVSYSTEEGQQEQMSQVQAYARWWLILATATVTMLLVAGIAWSLHHPYGTSWDEAQYLNEAQIDGQRLQHGMLLRLGGRILIESFGRPPAYQILALPPVGLFGFSATAARSVSFICFLLSSLFIYLGNRRIARTAASALSVLIFCLSPVVAGASIWFSTEGPLYLATSAMMYYILAIWTEKSPALRHWVGLGLAMGLGLLSKASFIAIMVPAMAYWFVLGLRRSKDIGNLELQGKAVALASLIALPWWVLNFRAAAAMAKEARGFGPNSLGSPSIGTWLRWLNTVSFSLIGYGLCILIGIIIAIWAYKRSTKSLVSNSLQQSALWLCLCAGAPIVLTQLTGTNHLLRHISPAVIPLAIAMGVLAEIGHVVRSRLFMTMAYVLCIGQLLMIIFPVVFPNTTRQRSWFPNAPLPWQVMGRRDQWDWSPLIAISRQCGLSSPAIAYLGTDPQLNPPQIQRSWAAAAARTGEARFPFPAVQSLWGYDDGPIDWGKVIRSAEQSDVVITVPQLADEITVKEDLGNLHNAELADRLSTDPLFRGPITVQMGRFKPVEILIFVKKSFSCQLSQQARMTR